MAQSGTTSILLSAFILAVTGSAATAQRFFEATNGPQGSGIFIGLAAGPDGTFFASDNVDGGTLFRSTDGGHEWQVSSRRDMAFGQGRISPILALPGGAVLASYATFDPFNMGGFWSRVYRSTSNGDSASWLVVPFLDSVGRVAQLVAGRPGTVVAAADSGLFRSTDNGGSWQRVTQRSDGQVWNAAVSTDGILYAIIMRDTAVGARAWRSRDDGLSWEPVGDTLPKFEGGISSPGGPAIVTHGGALLIPLYGGDGVMRLDSTAGSIWTLSSNGLPPSTGVTNLVVQDNATLFAGTSSGIFRSIDDGHSWTMANFSHLLPVNAFAAFGSTVLVANSGSLYRSEDDGATFAISGDGITHSSPFGLVVTPAGTLIATQDDNVFRSTNEGGHWEPLPLPLPKEAILWDMAAAPNGTVLAGTISVYVGLGTGGLIYRSADDGLTWAPSTIGLAATEIQDLAFRDGYWFAATDSGIYRSVDDGISWVTASDGLPSLQTTRIAISPDGTLIAGTNGAGCFKSVDHGATWTDANNGSSATRIRTLLAANDGTIYMANTAGQSLFRSTTTDAAWTDLSDRIPPIARIWASAVNGDGTVFLSALDPDYNGLNLRSTDKGESWEAMSDSLFFNVATFDAAGRMYVASNGYGVWRSIRSTTTSVPVDVQSQALNLSVTGTGEVAMHIPFPADVDISVFDCTGRLARTLFVGHREEGNFQIRAGDELPESGAYIVRVRCAGRVEFVPFVLRR